MCTVTIVPMNITGGRRGFRLACNRDEAERRPAALPPRVERFDTRLAVMPIDPVSGGTWIAANDAGLVMTLLNATPEPVRASPRELISRGLIIPSLIDSPSAAHAEQRALLGIEPARHAPFRLVITDGRHLSDLISDGHHLRARRGPLGSRPWLFTSSGLGDLLVRGPRTRLFEAFFHSTGDPLRKQDSFHRHSWPDRPEVSVCMRRPGARTVSHTVIESAGDRVEMLYLPDAPDSMAFAEEGATRVGLGLMTRAGSPVRAAC